MIKKLRSWKGLFLSMGIIILAIAGFLQSRTGSFEFPAPIAINAKDWVFQIGGFVQFMCLVSVLCLGFSAYAFWKGDEQSETDRLMTIIKDTRADHRRVVDQLAEIAKVRSGGS